MAQYMYPTMESMQSVCVTAGAIANWLSARGQGST